MKRAAVVPWIAVCFLLPFAAVIRPAQNVTQLQASEVREIIHRYLDAREHHDAKALAELFTPEVDQLVSSGEWRKGRDAVVRGTLASSESTGGHRSITIQTIRLLAPTVVLADGPYELMGLAGGEDRKMWTSFLLTRSSAGWRIAAIRNMLPAAPAPRR